MHQDLSTWISECCVSVADAREGAPALKIAETYLADQRFSNRDGGALISVVERLKSLGHALADGSSLLKLGGALPLSRVTQERCPR